MMHELDKAIRLHLNDAANLFSADQGHKDYNRFIILGRSRVGSNMLRSILNAHEYIYVYGELFRTFGEVGWDLPYYRPRRLNLFRESRLLKRHPINFLETKVFKRYPEDFRAVGFKIFYYHAQKAGWKEVWDYLKDNDIKVIHLKRRNVFKVHLSKKLAEESGNWKGGTYANRVKLDPGECREAFEKTESWWEKFDEYFQHNDVLEVWYEQLTADIQSETKRLFDFLEVDMGTRPLLPATRKQARKQPSQLVENYEELREHFLNTKWAKFFPEK